VNGGDEFHTFTIPLQEARIVTPAKLSDSTSQREESWAYSLTSLHSGAKEADIFTLCSQAVRVFSIHEEAQARGLPLLSF
jgi:hypothetical protein